MTGYVTTDSEITSPHFGRAWRDQYGFTHASVGLNENRRIALHFDDPATARAVAAACTEAAEAMEALPPAATEPEDPRG